MEKVALIQKKPGDAHKIPIVVKIPEAPDDEKITTYFGTISQCLNERRAIEMVYRAQHTKEVTNRIVDPYGLVFYDGMWIVIGYCHLRKDIRTFAFDRIIELKERNLYFKPRKDFNLEEYLSKSWGIVEDEEVSIRLRFSSKIADYVLRKK
jgi:predicted DNA-binding transcriptional regulator YafY